MSPATHPTPLLARFSHKLSSIVLRLNVPPVVLPPAGHKKRAT